MFCKVLLERSDEVDGARAEVPHLLAGNDLVVSAAGRVLQDVVNRFVNKLRVGPEDVVTGTFRGT